MTNDKKIRMCEAMELYGGNFAKALGRCFLLADMYNLVILENAFPHEVEKYMEFADILEKRRSEG